MKTVAVIEGWAGGPRLSRKFTNELKNRGFRPTKKLKEAEIIIAHSTGCYLLPQGINAELLVMMDPPYWPGRAIIGRWADLMRTDRTLLLSGGSPKDFLTKKVWEIYYIFAKPRFTWSVLKNQSGLEFLNQFKDKKLLLIRNVDDEFCSPEIKAAVAGLRNLKYYELPGNHEDYYVNPQPYIDLLLKELQ